jgi:hypothetical protein
MDSPSGGPTAKPKVPAMFSVGHKTTTESQVKIVVATIAPITDPTMPDKRILMPPSYRAERLKAAQVRGW